MLFKESKYKRSLFVFLFISLFGFDLVYSYQQHLAQNIDGDFAESVLPMDYIQTLWDSPLGAKAILEGERYHNPNRFFSHFSYYQWFDKVPKLFRQFCTPVDSIYQSAALFKILVQIGLIVCIAGISSRSCSWRKNSFLIAVVLLFPLFQTNGYQGHIGVIDRAITYVFFYAFPLLLLCLYVWPVLVSYLKREAFAPSLLMLVLVWPFSLIICLSGPLNPAVILVLVLLIGLDYLRKGIWPWRIPKAVVLYLIPATLMSLYSLYLGQFNSASLVEEISLLDLYSKLPSGFIKQFTQKLAFPMLFLVLIINYILLRRQEEKGIRQNINIKAIYNVIIIFSMMYILLLPLGGYRIYRPYILRYDTIMPVTLALMFLYVYGSKRLLHSLRGYSRVFYSVFLFLILCAFTFSDQLEADRNDCQKELLNQLAKSEQEQLVLSGDCLVLSWEKISEESDSEAICKTLHKLGLAKEDLSFRQE